MHTSVINVTKEARQRAVCAAATTVAQYRKQLEPAAQNVRNIAHFLVVDHVLVYEIIVFLCSKLSSYS